MKPCLYPWCIALRKKDHKYCVVHAQNPKHVPSRGRTRRQKLWLREDMQLIKLKEAS